MRGDGVRAPRYINHLRQATHLSHSCYINNFGQQVCQYNAWDSWVRWLVLGLIVGGALLIFFLFRSAPSSTTESFTSSGAFTDIPSQLHPAYGA